MIARCVVLGAVLLAAPGVCAAESLMDAIALAYQTNPNLRAQRAELRSADENYVQARAGFGPQVSITGQAGYDDARVQQGQFGFTSNTDYRAGTGQADLSAVQPIYTSGAASAQARGASAGVAAGRQNLRQAESQLLVNVVTAYLDVRRDRQISVVIKDEIATLNRAYEETKAKAALGQLSKTDVAQAQARLLSSQAQLYLALGRLNVSSAEYLAVVGQNPGELEPEPELAGLPDQPDQAFEAAEHNNPQLLAAIDNEKAAREKVNQAKAQLGPTVSIRLDAAVAPIEPYLPRQYQRSVTGAVVVTQPLYTSGLNTSKVRQAQDEDSKAELTIEATRRTVVQQVSQAWNQVNATRQALLIEQRQVEAEAVAATGDQLEERAGLRSIIELLNAEQEQANAKIGLVQARHDEYVARATLLSAMGLLEAKLLIPSIQAYDPQRSLKRVELFAAAPWEGAVATIDSIADPKTHEPRMSAPGAGGLRPTDLTPPSPAPGPASDSGAAP
jgi:outer membrane protein